MRRAPVLGLLIAIAFIPAGATEVDKKGFQTPIPSLAIKRAIFTRDFTDRIPGQETLVKVYQKKTGGKVYQSFEIEGKVYAWQYMVKGKPEDSPVTYAIVDTDGDGVFETKYGIGESAKTPEWAIQHYFKTQAENPPSAPPVSPAPPRPQ